MDRESTSRIVRWEILPGLPGEGPIPHHFHLGHPTPWKEGFVVRFWNADGSEWVGNFQDQTYGHSEVVVWPEANTVAVIAGGYFYFIDAGNPGSYWTLGSQCSATGMAFDEQRQMLFVADSYCIYAYDVKGRQIWKKGPGAYITRITSCLGTVLTVELDPETTEPLEIVQLSTEPESVDDRRYLDILFKTLEIRTEVERIDPGLSDAEVQAVERRFQFMFPADLRGVLQFAVPIGKSFPNWREVLSEDLQRRFDGPLDGICFDIENNNFWWPEWGAKPSNPGDRRKVVRENLSEAPRLIPVFGHRYIPNVPHQNGNPVFSVHQTDIIYYGNDLADYFHHEFGVPLPQWAARTPRPIRFWDDALRWRD